MSKKILISIDHKWRDLPGHVYLGQLLRKRGFEVAYTLGQPGMGKYIQRSAHAPVI